jgi:hypothetical protein
MRRPSPKPATYVVLTSMRGFNDVWRALHKRMSVSASGQGTVEDPEAYWFELRGTPTLDELREALSGLDCIRVFEQAVEGAGKDLAAQLPLISHRQDGLWRSGVPGGPVPKDPEPKAKPAPTSTQMPLFD